jgi:hypothetical protein
MPFVHGKKTAVLFDQYDLSAYLNEASYSAEIETAETTAFGNNSKAYIPGLADGTVSLSGMFEGSANSIDATLATSLGATTDNVLTTAIGGNTIGNRARLAAIQSTSYEVTAPVGDIVSASAELQCDGGLDAGIVLAAGVTASATGSQTGQDNGASTTNGGVGHLHVTSNTRNGAVQVLVEHSADNSTWATLVTFTATTSSTTLANRQVITTNPVNRYLRATVSSVAGSTGSITYSVAFARR